MSSSAPQTDHATDAADMARLRAGQAEALDDLPVPDRVAQLLRVEALHQCTRQDLVRQRLAVFERQVRA